MGEGVGLKGLASLIVCELKPSNQNLGQAPVWPQTEWLEVLVNGTFDVGSGVVRLL